MAKLSIEVTDELKARLDKITFWGVQSAVMRVLIENLCDTCEKHGTGVLQLIIEGKYNVLTKEVKL